MWSPHIFVCFKRKCETNWSSTGFFSSAGCVFPMQRLFHSPLLSEIHLLSLSMVTFLIIWVSCQIFLTYLLSLSSSDSSFSFLSFSLLSSLSVSFPDFCIDISLVMFLFLMYFTIDVCILESCIGLFLYWVCIHSVHVYTKFYGVFIVVCVVLVVSRISFFLVVCIEIGMYWYVFGCCVFCIGFCICSVHVCLMFCGVFIIVCFLLVVLRTCFCFWLYVLRLVCIWLLCILYWVFVFVLFMYVSCFVVCIL